MLINWSANEESQKSCESIKVSIDVYAAREVFVLKDKKVENKKGDNPHYCESENIWPIRILGYQVILDLNEFLLQLVFIGINNI